MDVFRPREPMHRARDFWKEVGIIVLGVLIALGAEQIVASLHWAREVRDAHAAFRNEMEAGDRKFAFRIAAESCVARRLDALAQITERVASHQAVPHLGPIQIDIANTYADDAWQAYRASDVLTHFKRPDLEQYDAYYDDLEHLRERIATEYDSWDLLERLQGDPARLGPDDIAILRGALVHARNANQSISRIGAGELRVATRLGVPVVSVDTARLRKVCAPLPVDVAAVAHD